MATNIAGFVQTQPTPQSTPERIQGRVVFDATAIVPADVFLVTAGFDPDYILWENITDQIKIEWYRGMADGTCIKTAASGARTLVASPNGINNQPAGSRFFTISQNATTGAIAASKTCAYLATAN